MTHGFNEQSSKEEAVPPERSLTTQHSPLGRSPLTQASQRGLAPSASDQRIVSGQRACTSSFSSSKHSYKPWALDVTYETNMRIPWKMDEGRLAPVEGGEKEADWLTGQRGHCPFLLSSLVPLGPPSGTRASDLETSIALGQGKDCLLVLQVQGKVQVHLMVKRGKA